MPTHRQTLPGLLMAVYLSLVAPVALVRAADPPINPKLPKATQASLWVARAENYQLAEKWKEAAEAFQSAADLTPEDWLLWERCGWAHLDNEDAAKGLKAFEASRKNSPQGAAPTGGLLVSHFALKDAAAVRTDLGALLDEDRLPAALAVINKGLAAKQGEPDWLYALGYIYARVLGNSSRGIGPLETLIEAEPKRAEAWLLLVDLNQALNRGRQEDAAAIKYLDLAPDTADAFRLRAQRFAVIQKYPEAIGEYQAAIQKYPDEEELYYQLARTQEKAGGRPLAESTLKQIIARAEMKGKASVRMRARAQLAQLQVRGNQFAEAAAFFEEAAAVPAANSATLTTLGSLQVLTGKWDEAAASLDRAAERELAARGTLHAAARDDILVARYHAAVCWLAAGKRDRATAGLRTALALKGESRTGQEAEVVAFLTWVGEDPKALAYARSDERWAAMIWRQMPEEGELEVRGRFSVAARGWRAILQQVQKTEPACWPANYALARIYAAGGFSDEAIRLLGLVNMRKPDWWASHYALGQYYAQRRDRDKGVPSLKRTLQLAPECRSARLLLTLLEAARDDGDNLLAHAGSTRWASRKECGS